MELSELRNRHQTGSAPLTLAVGFCASTESRGMSEADRPPGDWQNSLGFVSAEFDVDDVGNVGVRFLRVERGDSLVMLLVRPREKKANASRTGPCV